MRQGDAAATLVVVLLVVLAPISVVSEVGSGATPTVPDAESTAVSNSDAGVTLASSTTATERTENADDRRGWDTRSGDRSAIRSHGTGARDGTVATDASSGGTIAGFVVRNSQTPTANSDFAYPPVSGATVTIVELGRTITTSIYGFYEFDGVPAGTYTVRASQEGFGTVSHQVVVTAGETNRTDFALNRSGARYHVGFSVEALHTAIPLENVTVELGNKTKQTNASGDAVFPHLTPGTYAAAVKTKGYENWQGTVTVGPRSKSVGVRMHPSQKYTINVTATGRAKANGATEDRLQQGTAKIKGVYRGRVVVEKEVESLTNGTASFPKMPPLPGNGSYHVNISAFGFKRYNATVDNVAPNPTDPTRSVDASMHLRPATLNVTVRHPQYIGPDGEIVTGTGYPTVPQVGKIVATLNGTGEHTQGIQATPAHGTTFTGLLPGKYRIELQRSPQLILGLDRFDGSFTYLSDIELENTSVTLGEKEYRRTRVNVTAQTQLINVSVLAMNLTRHEEPFGTYTSVQWEPMANASIEYGPPNAPETDHGPVLANARNGTLQGQGAKVVYSVGGEFRRWSVLPEPATLPNTTGTDGNVRFAVAAGFYDFGANDSNDIRFYKQGYATNNVSYLRYSGPGGRTIGMHVNETWVHGQLKALRTGPGGSDNDEEDLSPEITLKNVTVTLESKSGGVVAQQQTTTDGRFDFGFVPWGEYELVVEDIRSEFDASYRDEYTFGIEPEFGALLDIPRNKGLDIGIDPVDLGYDDHEIDDTSPGSEVRIDLNLTQANEHGYRHNLFLDGDLEYGGNFSEIEARSYVWQCDDSTTDCPENGAFPAQPTDELAGEEIYYQTPHFAATHLTWHDQVLPGKYRVVPREYPTTTVTVEGNETVIAGDANPRYEPRVEDPDGDTDNDGESEDGDSDGESNPAGVINPSTVDDEKVNNNGNGTARFFVYDSRTNEPLEGIRVVLENSNTGKTVDEKLTGSDGRVVFENVQFGNYAYTVRSPDANYVSRNSIFDIAKDQIVTRRHGLDAAQGQVRIKTRTATRADLGGATIKLGGGTYTTNASGELSQGYVAVSGGLDQTVVASKSGYVVAGTNETVARKNVSVPTSNETVQRTVTFRFERIEQPEILDASMVRGTSTNESGLYLGGVNVTQILTLEIDHDNPPDDPPVNVTLRAETSDGSTIKIPAEVKLRYAPDPNPPLWVTDNNDDGIAADADYLLGLEFDVADLPPGRNNLSVSFDTKAGAPHVNKTNITVNGSTARVDVLAIPPWLSRSLRDVGPQGGGINVGKNMDVPDSVDLSGQYEPFGSFFAGLDGGYGRADTIAKYSDDVRYVIRPQQEYSITMETPASVLATLGLVSIGYENIVMPTWIEVSSENRSITLRKDQSRESGWEEDALESSVKNGISAGIGALVNSSDAKAGTKAVLQLTVSVTKSGSVNALGSGTFEGPVDEFQHSHGSAGDIKLYHDHHFQRNFSFVEVYNTSSEVSVSYPLPIGEYLIASPEPVTSGVGALYETLERFGALSVSGKVGYRRHGRDIYQYNETYPEMVGWLAADDDLQKPNGSKDLFLRDQIFGGLRAQVGWGTFYLEGNIGVGMDYGRDLRLDPPYLKGYGLSLIITLKGGAPGLGSFNEEIPFPLSYSAREGSETNVTIEPDPVTSYTLPASDVSGVSDSEYSRFEGADGSNTLVSKAYPQANPAVGIAGGSPTIAYLREDRGTTSPDATVQSTALSGGSWSSPAAISSSGSHVAIGGTATERASAAVWRDTSAVGDGFRALGLYKSELWYATGGPNWGQPRRLTDNEALESKPDVSVDGGEAMVVWRENPSGHPLDFDGQHVRFAIVGSDSGTPTPGTIVSDVTMLGQPAVSYDGGTAVLAYLSDADGNLKTTGDRTVKVARYDGSSWSTPTTLMSGSIGQVDVARSNGTTRLAWVADDDLRAGRLSFSGSVSLASNHTVKSALGIGSPEFLRGGDGLVFGAGTGDSLGIVYLATVGDGDYSDVQSVTPADTYFGSVDAAATADGDVYVAGLATANATDAVPDLDVVSVNDALGTTKGPGNQAPTASNVSVTTDENESVTGGFAASDPEGDPLSYALASTPANGSVTISGSNFTYTPDSGFNGTDSFVYQVSDGNGGTDTATVTVTVEVPGSNGPPNAMDQSLTMLTNETLTRPFNATDPDGDPLTFQMSVPPTNVSVSITGDNFTIDPDPGFTGLESFVYEAEDSSGATDTATVLVDVNPRPNRDPTASNVSVTTEANASVTAGFNASDPDGDALTFTVASGPSNGTVSISGSNFTYTPDSGFTGTDSFVYRVSDGMNTTTATVTVTVTPATNDSPTASNVSVTTAANASVTGSFNASDPNGDALTYGVASGPSNGSVSVSGSNFTYTPDSGFTGTDSFVYRVSDGSNGTDTATVTITVSGSDTNEPPTATNVSVSGGVNATINGSLNASDPDGDALSYGVASGPSNGSVSLAGSNFTYTPDSGFTGTDSFRYRVSDGNGGTDTATVRVTVTPAPNSPPTASNVSVTTDANASVTASFDASDPDGDSLSYGVASGPSNGSVSISGANFTYTPESGFNGTDAFTYRVSDGAGGTDTATVTVTVQGDDGFDVSDYDDDGDGIEIGELGAAAADFAQDELTIGQLGAVAAAFASNLS